MTDKPSAPLPIAVALSYDRTSAPRVSAKGKGHLAERIIKLAKEHKVPIREEPELTGLLAQVDLGHEIPEALYVAVAQVLAFAYLLKGKAQNS